MNLLKKTLVVMLMAVVSVSVYGQVLTPKQNSKGKFGFVDESGKWIIKPKYSAVTDFDNHAFAVVEKDGLKGLINNKGKEVVKPKYLNVSPIPYLSSYVFFVDAKGSSVYYFDCINGITFSVTDFNSKTTEHFTELGFNVALYSGDYPSLYIESDAYKRKNFGLDEYYHNKETKYKLLSVPLNSPISINGESHNELVVDNRNYCWQFNENNNVMIIAPQDRWSNRDKEAYVIRNGDIILRGKVSKFEETKGNGMINAKISVNDSTIFRVIDNNVYNDTWQEIITGKYQLPLKDGTIREFDNLEKIIYDNYLAEHYLVQENGVWKIIHFFCDDIRIGVVDEDYTFKNPGDKKPDITVIETYRNRYFIIEDNEKYGLLRYYGSSLQTELPCEYDEIKVIYGDLFSVFKEGKSMLYEVSSGKFANIGNGWDFVDTDDLTNIIVKNTKTGKAGLQKEGAMFIKAEYDSLKFAANYIEIVGFKKNLKYLINLKTGRIIADGTKYDRIRETFNKATYTAQKGNKVGVINAETGKLLAPTLYDAYLCAGRGYNIMLNESGNKVILYVYDANGTLKESKSFFSNATYSMEKYSESWCGSFWPETDGTADYWGYIWYDLKK